MEESFQMNIILLDFDGASKSYVLWLTGNNKGSTSGGKVDRERILFLNIVYFN